MQKPLNIGVITRYTGNCYHGALIQAIHQSILDNNAKMYVLNTFMIYRFCNAEEKDLMFYKLAFNHIDGWIVLTDGASSRMINMILKTGKPLITIGFAAEGVTCGTVQEDSYTSARETTQHLIDHGHNKIIYIGCSNLYDMYQRFQGYKKALEDNGIAFDSNLCATTGKHDAAMTQFGKDAIKDMLKGGYTFSAVFAANDYFALGAMEGIAESGLRVPEDVAVIGYDNTPHAKGSNPGLTSVSQDFCGMGLAAVETLIKSINDKSLHNETILVKSNLVIRNSCGCFNQQTDLIQKSYMEDVKFKDTVLKYLEQEISKNYDTASELLRIDIKGIKKLIPELVGNYLMQCIGFWDNNSDKKNVLHIEQVTNAKTKTSFNPNTLCTIEDFPPAEFINYEDSSNDDFIWMLPISTATRDWCIISFVAPLNKANISSAYDNSLMLLNLLGIYLDHEVTNSELKNTLETLQKTQEQLIQSEKMVSLGTLVAGVAHEINTPIGVSVTAASFMQENSKKLMELFETGKLKRSDMENYFKLSAETNDILLINLSKASNLIKSFKQIAIDQSIEEKRMFNVNKYINEVLLSLNPKLKMTKIKVNIDCPEDIEIYSYPGGLSQILTNLVVNSIIHAYDEGEEGTISIKISTEDHTMEFIYSDDGKGISKGTLSKIFDPFFTTKRGTGGTGLGLNIVYNIVTQQYGGSIRCESVFGNGTTFIINMPINGV